MPSTRQRAPLRKRNLRNGALLAVSEAAKLVNIPLAQDVARHIRQVAVALKPSVLQAPKANDSNARDLAKHVQGLLDVLNRTVRYLDDSSLGGIDYHEEMLVELHQLHTHMSDTYSQLQEVQVSPYSTKLASQAEIRERILQLKEELSRAILDFTLRLLVAVMASSTQNQLVVANRLDSTLRKHNVLMHNDHTLTREHNTLALKHNALVRVSRRRQRILDKRIRGLERECKGLTRRVNAVLLIQQTDERVAYLVALTNGIFFLGFGNRLIVNQFL